MRVRRPLDEFAAWRLAELRRHGMRVSTAELTEMLLWELTRDDVSARRAHRGVPESSAARTALAARR